MSMCKPHQFRIKIHEEELELFKKFNNPKILDVCSGEGNNVLGLREKGYDVVGIDTKEFGKEFEGINILDIYEEKFHFRDNSFDIVINYQYINHNYKEKIEDVFKEIYRVLKPKGLFSMKVTDIEQFKLEHVEGNKYKDLEVDEGFTSTYFEKIAPQTFIKLDGEEKGIPHYGFYEDELKESLEKIGFKIINIRKVRWNLVVNCSK